MGNLMGCGGNRLEVDGEAVVEANSSSVQERIQYHKGVVDGLDVEIRKQATLETNAVDEIEKGKATLDKGGGGSQTPFARWGRLFLGEIGEKKEEDADLMNPPLYSITVCASHCPFVTP
ncbi:unnamed protein product [Brassica napus]|uniref:(rape) hypothetical protein n=1 Tax=Brassica napus TaxID=3708 RepID=A0A817B588_BRANA|nr:unnamed protein product [Brassica napus]